MLKHFSGEDHDTPTDAADIEAVKRSYADTEIEKSRSNKRLPRSNVKLLKRYYRADVDSDEDEDETDSDEEDTPDKMKVHPSLRRTNKSTYDGSREHDTDDDDDVEDDVIQNIHPKLLNWVTDKVANSEKIVRIKDRKMRVHNIIELFDAMKYHQTITHLYLVNADIDDMKLKMVATALLRFPNIEFLSVTQNNISDKGALTLYAMLHKTGVKTLFIDENRLTDIGAKALSKLVEEGSLKVLDMHNNASISDKLKGDLKMDKRIII